MPSWPRRTSGNLRISFATPTGTRLRQQWGHVEVCGGVRGGRSGVEWGKLVSPCLSCVLFFWQRACERACGLVIYLSAQHQSALFFQQYRLNLLSLSPFSCLSPPAVCSYYTYLTAFNQRIFTLNLTNLLIFYLIFRAARISFTPFSSPFPYSFPFAICFCLCFRFIGIS